MNERSNRRIVVLLALIVILLAGILGTLVWWLSSKANTPDSAPARLVSSGPAEKPSNIPSNPTTAPAPSPAAPAPKPPIEEAVSLFDKYYGTDGTGTAPNIRPIADAVLSLVDGSNTGPDNPSFPLTIPQAHSAILAMTDKPLPLSRTLVIIGGYEDPLISQTLATEYFRAMLKDPQLVTVSLIGCGSFDECRARILAAVNSACGSIDPNWTAEVDVVGVSLGGMAARYAAAPSRDPHAPQRLRIARLFTLSSPLAGAKVAMLGFTDFQRDIQPGSDMQKYLAAVEPNPKYEIYSYVHLGDEMVGQENAAIPGRIPYWLPNIPGLPILPHEAIMVDERVFADIARRLRGEAPFTLPKMTPLPTAK